MDILPVVLFSILFKSFGFTGHRAIIFGPWRHWWPLAWPGHWGSDWPQPCWWWGKWPAPQRPKCQGGAATVRSWVVLQQALGTFLKQFCYMWSKLTSDGKQLSTNSFVTSCNTTSREKTVLSIRKLSLDMFRWANHQFVTRWIPEILHSWMRIGAVWPGLSRKMARGPIAEACHGCDECTAWVDVWYHVDLFHLFRLFGLVKPIMKHWKWSWFEASTTNLFVC